MFARHSSRVINSYCQVQRLNIFCNNWKYKNHKRYYQLSRIPLHKIKVTTKFATSKRQLHDGNVLTAARTFWKNLFSKYLLLTNTVTSGVLMVIGDIAAQEIFYFHSHGSFVDIKYLDGKRLMNMFIVGAIQGPLHHYIYLWLDRALPLVTLKNTILKILFDQIFMSPLCLAVFFYSICWLECKTVEETNKEICDKFVYMYVMDWLFWPGAQFINFHYLNTKYRVLFVNVCTALYNVALSFMRHDCDL